MPKEFSCPSCGADLKLKREQTHVRCPYCESTVLVPEEFRSRPEEPAGQPAAPPDYQAAQRAAVEQAARSAKFGRYLGCILPLVIIGFVLFMNWQFNPAVRGMFGGAVEKAASSVGLAEGREVLSFGGEGTGAGLFEDARFVTADAGGNIYVAEFDTGRIQVFDPEGGFRTQWFLEAEDGDDEVYISGMDATSDGRLAIARESELHIYDGQTGEHLRELEHPDGWGFEDVCVADDGSVVATWYKSRDDVVRFSPEGELDLHIPEVVSGVTGDSELECKVAVGGRGDIYVLGTFNTAVLRYSRSGEFRNRFGSEGDAEGQFSSPGAIAVDGRGNPHVADMFGVMVFASDGRYLDTWLEGGYVFDMDYRDGRMYTVDNREQVRVMRVPELE